MAKSYPNCNSSMAATSLHQAESVSSSSVRLPDISLLHGSASPMFLTTSAAKWYQDEDVSLVEILDEVLALVNEDDFISSPLDHGINSPDEHALSSSQSTSRAPSARRVRVPRRNITNREVDTRNSSDRTPETN